MTKVLCQEEKCVHCIKWVCELDVLHMKPKYHEVQRMHGYSDGYLVVECRDRLV
jgi:hypothetical protein